MSGLYGKDVVVVFRPQLLVVSYHCADDSWRASKAYAYRFNNRKASDLFGMTVRRMALVGAMPYAQLVEENASTPFIRRQK